MSLIRFDLPFVKFKMYCLIFNKIERTFSYGVVIIFEFISGLFKPFFPITVKFLLLFIFFKF